MTLPTPSQTGRKSSKYLWNEWSSNPLELSFSTFNKLKNHEGGLNSNADSDSYLGQGWNLICLSNTFQGGALHYLWQGLRTLVCKPGELLNCLDEVGPGWSSQVPPGVILDEGQGGACSSPLWLWQGVSRGERPWDGGTS